jgi:hypothetical protein
LSAVKVDRMKPGKAIQALEASVVTIVGITLTGVS